MGRRRAPRVGGPFPASALAVSAWALAVWAWALAVSAWAAFGAGPTAHAQAGGPYGVTTVSESARERHARAQDAVLARVAELAVRIEPAGVGFIRPVGGPVSSYFGWRDLFVSGSRFHGGVDIAADTGTPVVASRGGRVSFAGWSGVYGYVVFLDHEEGWQTRYAHLSRIDARVGDALRQGAPLGAVGSTGLSTGPHLHFEVRYDGRALDPFDFVPR